MVAGVISITFQHNGLSMIKQQLFWKSTEVVEWFFDTTELVFLALLRREDHIT
jgi:hypothetical protein